MLPKFYKSSEPIHIRVRGSFESVLRWINTQFFNKVLKHPVSRPEVVALSEFRMQTKLLTMYRKFFVVGNLAEFRRDFPPYLLLVMYYLMKKRLALGVLADGRPPNPETI